MAEPIATYTLVRRGFWKPRIEISGPDGPLGVLQTERRGLILSGATFQPEKGEVIHIRRDPGLLRAQFSMWTEAREWLGSSLRWSFFTRPVTIHTGTKPQQLLAKEGFGPGWRLVAPKTGDIANLSSDWLSRRSKLEVYRRLDFELVLFSAFLGNLMRWELLLPGPVEHRSHKPEKAPSSAGSGAQA